MFYQLYLRTLGGPLSSDAMFPHLHHLNTMSSKQRRLEQSLYWSCFKSECEYGLPFQLASIPDTF